MRTALEGRFGDYEIIEYLGTRIVSTSTKSFHKGRCVKCGDEKSASKQSWKANKHLCKVEPNIAELKKQFKACPKCEKNLSLNNFYKSTAKGRQSYCKICSDPSNRE